MFASLWLGDDTVTGEPVLVEVIRASPPPKPEDAKLLRDRMAAAQDLPPHPGLLAVRSIHAPEPPGRLAVATRAAARARARHGIEEQQWLLVLDPFDGSTLDHRAAFGDLSPAAVCAIAAKVGEALGALHSAGIAHGSVSQASVLVSDAGDVRLIDALVGSWWNDRGQTESAIARDRRGDDVAALARTVNDLLSPVAVPLPARRPLERGSRASLGELVAALREAGLPASRTEAEVEPGGAHATPIAPHILADPASAVTDVAPDPVKKREAARTWALEERRRRERERAEASRRRADERKQADELRRAELRRRRAEEAAARRDEHERRKAQDADELRLQLEREAEDRAQHERAERFQEAPPQQPEVVVVPHADEHGSRRALSDTPMDDEPRLPGVSAARAAVPSADRPAGRNVAVPTETERVIHLPDAPPATPTSYLDWASPAPTVRSSLPSGEAMDWSAPPETEPTRWMKALAAIASVLMFVAIGAAVYYLVQSGS